MVVAVVAMLCVALHFRSHFTNDLAYLFPKDSVSGNFYRTIQEARLTQSIQLEISCGKQLTRTELHPILDEIALEISVLPEVASATASFRQESDNLLDEILAATPCMTSPEILEKADPATAVTAARKALAMPGVPLEFLRKDPLNLRLAPLERLQEFRSLFGLKADTSDGYLILEEEEGLRALILVNTNFANAPNADTIWDLFRELFFITNKHLPQAEISLISPLWHNLENEKNVRKDILKVSIASFVVLLLLFVIVYRGAWDALLIPLMPLMATILVTGVMVLCLQNLCIFIVGIGGGIAGLAVDQGIHIYAACTGKERMQGILRLLPPLLMSLCTSAAVFLLVAGTGITAYIQLGIFVAATLFLNLLLSLAFLPLLVRRRELFSFAQRPSSPSKPWVDGVICGIWLLLVIVSILTIPRLKINLSIRALDGTSPKLLAAEEEFQKRWFQPDAGTVIALTAASAEQALRQCEELAQLPVLQQAPLFHCGALWPSQEIREKNLAAWRSPTVRETLQTLQRRYQKECAAAHLPPKFFDVGFERLFSTLDASQTPPQPTVIQTISRHLLRDYGSSTTAILLSGIPREQQTAELIDALADHPNVALLTADAFQKAAIHDLWPRIRRILFLLVPVLLLAMFPLLRQPLQLLFVLIPGATAVLLGGAVFAANGVPLNLISLLAILMLSGLVLDYGIFALAIAKSSHPNSMTIALGLSALTTQLTTSVMGISEHPVMRNTGVVFYLGIVLTSLTALCVVPALLNLAKRTRLHRFLPLLLVLLCASGCLSNLSPQDKTVLITQPEELNAFVQQFNSPSKRLFTMKTSYLWFDFTMLLAVRVEDKKLTAIGTATNGATLFTVKDRQVTFSSAIPAIAQRKLFANLASDLERVFLPGREFGSTFTMTYGGKPLHLLEQKSGKFPFRSWQAVYYDWDARTGTYGSIRYRNYGTKVTFTFTNHLPLSP